MDGNDDEDFEDLLDETELLQDALDVSLTSTEADVLCTDNARIRYTSRSVDVTPLQTTFASSIQTGEESNLFMPDCADAQPLQMSTLPENLGDAPSRSCVLGTNATMIQSIESVFEEITDALLNQKTEIGVTLKTRNLQSVNKTGRDGTTGPTWRLCFPGKTPEEAWRFSVVVRILELMHEALRNDTVLSKRDIYYRDPALFGDQRHVDRYVDDIALTFGTTRSALNVTAMAKGLVAGQITFVHKDGAHVNANIEQEGLLIPSLKDIVSVSMTAVKWILVVEKEASFRSIVASRFWEKVTTEGILLTGKGYPDLASRAMLRFLSTPSAQNGFASPPVFGLADFDPDGIAILTIYKHGSNALNHETKLHEVPNLEWLGLRSDSLQLCGCDQRAAQGILTLTNRDRRKAINMLHSSLSDNDGSQLLQKELQTMLMLNMKAELQLFDTSPTCMADFLIEHLSRFDVSRC